MFQFSAYAKIIKLYQCVAGESWVCRRLVPEHRAAERRVTADSARHGDGRFVGHSDPVPRLQTRQTVPDLHAGIGGGEFAVMPSFLEIFLGTGKPFNLTIVQ